MTRFYGNSFEFKPTVTYVLLHTLWLGCLFLGFDQCFPGTPSSSIYHIHCSFRRMALAVWLPYFSTKSATGCPLMQDTASAHDLHPYV
jgi:hypothetical protein